MKKLKIKRRKHLTEFLDSFAKVSESFIVNVEEKLMTVIAASPDNTLILYGEYEIDTDITGALNIPDGRKLVRLLESIDDDDIELIINENNLEYKSKRIKFKYHLLEDNWLRPPGLKVDKIKSFEYDVNYDVTKTSIQAVIKGSSFTPESNKLYMSVDDGSLIGELTDKSKHNSDLYTIEICETDQKSVPVTVNLDNIRLLSLISEDVRVAVNEQYGVVLFQFKTENTDLSYIVTTLTQ